MLLALAGVVTASEELDPNYRHAGIDIFLAEAFQGRSYLMRDYDRGPDGTWCDGLLMDLPGSEFEPGD